MLTKGTLRASSTGAFTTRGLSALACGRGAEASQRIFSAANLQSSGSISSVLVRRNGGRGYVTEAARSLVRREVELLEDAYQAGVPIGRDRVIRALQLCSRSRDTELATKMVQLGKKLRPNDKLVRNAIMSTHGNLGALDQVKENMAKMEQLGVPQLKPNAVSWNTLIASCARAGQRGQALTALNRMQEAGFLPDRYTFNALIKAHIAVGDLDEALAVFELMKARRIEPNERTYAMLINGHLKKGLNDQAALLLKDMEGRRITPSVETLTPFVYANSKANAIDASQRILERLNEAGQKPNCVLYTTLIEGLVRNGLTDQAFTVFREMVDQQGLAPDTLTYTSLLKAVRNDPEKAWDLYQDMRSRGVLPDAIFYRDLLRTQRNKADDATFFQLVDDTIKAGTTLAPTLTAPDCHRLLGVLSSRPAAAVRAWRAMLRAQLPLNRDSFDLARKLIAQANDADARTELEQLDHMAKH